MGKVLRGHSVEYDGPTLGGADRWTCIRCGRAVLWAGGPQGYGSALDSDCISAINQLRRDWAPPPGWGEAQHIEGDDSRFETALGEALTEARRGVVMEIVGRLTADDKPLRGVEEWVLEVVREAAP